MRHLNRQSKSDSRSAHHERVHILRNGRQVVDIEIRRFPGHSANKVSNERSNNSATSTELSTPNPDNSTAGVSRRLDLLERIDGELFGFFCPGPCRGIRRA